MANEELAFETIGERELGGRKYIIRSDERLIGVHEDGWELSELEAWSSEDWMSLRLLDTAAERRVAANGGKMPRMRVYQLGFHKGHGRVARNTYWGRLSSAYPDVAQWVLFQLERGQA